MKKLYIFLLSTIALTSVVKAQHWALPSSEWRILITSNEFPQPPINIYKVQDDTIIGGILCKHIYAAGYIETSIYSYEKSDTVFFFHNGQFYPALYFSVQQGDTVAFPVFGMYCSNETEVPFVECVIDSIGLLDIGGKIARRFYFSQTSSQNYDIADYETNKYYMEFVGANNLFPVFNCAGVTDLDWYSLCSYYDSSLSSQYAPISVCAASSIAEVKNEKFPFILYPNPVREVLHISYDEIRLQENVAVEVTDLLGSVVLPLQEIKTQTEGGLGFNDIPQGIYVCSIHVNKQLVYREKILVLR